MTPFRTLAIALLLLLAAGSASAQACPECDSDGTPDHNASYSSVDAGYTNSSDAGAGADTDASVSDKDHKNGWFTWLSFCLDGFVAIVEEITGTDETVDAKTEAYVSEDGADLDANLTVLGESVDYDKNEVVGQTDNMSWGLMAKVKAFLGIQKLPHPVGGEALPDVDEDVCGEATLTC